MPVKASAAIITIGTELVTGLRLDTNGAEIAASLASAGYSVTEMLSLGDDIALVARHIGRLCDAYELVVVTGGLGPTHDDITREAASEALGRPLSRDESIAKGLAGVIGRHRDPEAAAQVLVQADVIAGARVIPATTGTAPGQSIPTVGGTLLLLPGPPTEMRPMLAAFLGTGSSDAVRPVRFRCTGTTESDVQMVVQRALAEHPAIELTLLASAGEIEIVLFDAGAGPDALVAAGAAVKLALGAVCFSDDGSTLAETVVGLAREAGATIATAESCTGGLVAAALTDVPGASDVLPGGVVVYSNELKTRVLDVPAGLLAHFGAVSPETATAMAEGARAITGASHVVSVTGIAGPGGATPGKPVGLVWFGLCTPNGTSVTTRTFMGDRTGVRARATVTALDLLRRDLAGL